MFKALRGTVAAVAVGALVQSVGSMALTPLAHASNSQVTAATAVNIRSGASTSSTRLAVLYKGQTIQAISSSQGWTAVAYRGSTAYIASNYLTGGSGAVAAPSTSTKGDVFTTGNLNLRTGPSLSSPVSHVAAKGTKLGLTGSISGSYSQVVHNSSTLWAATSYLSSAASVPSSPTPPSTSAGTSGSLNRGSSSGLDNTTEKTKNVIRHVWTTQPAIKTMYGVRSDSMADHPSGRAVDVMLPNYKANNALGWEIARYYRANAQQFGITYIIFDQQIWSVQRDKEGWRKMSGRGSDSANHINHVHINT